MEIFDIVDENGMPTGETVERTAAHSTGARHRTAHVWVADLTGERPRVLLQKRAANKDSFPGRFDTSSAGHIQAGDEPLDSALRELAEELGIRAAAEDLTPVGTFRIAYEKEFYGKMFRDSEVAFVYLYTRPVELSGLTLQAEEVECVEWFDLEEVIREVTVHNQKFCVPPDSLKLLARFLSKADMEIRTARMEDLDALAAVEAACFPAAEAATRDAFISRIQTYGNHFWLMFDGDKLVSFVDGFVTDAPDLEDEMYEKAQLHNEQGVWQMIFGVNTIPAYRRRGCAGKLLQVMIEDARKQGRKGLVLTCKDRLVPYYAKFGFVSEGVSEKSVHGNAVWNQMRLTF